MKISLILCLAILPVTGCMPPQPMAAERPMDEVPLQERMANGDRHYSFRNGCVIAVAPDRAVVTSAGAVCEGYQRDIALLYAAGD